MEKILKTNQKQQYNILLEIQNAGFNICTCGCCGYVILYNKEMKESDAIVCYNCKTEQEYCETPDYYDSYVNLKEKSNI